MHAVVSRVFFYKNIARLLLRNIPDNFRKYKANFLWWFRTNLRVLLISILLFNKKNARMIFSVKRELVARRRMKKQPTIYVTYFYKYCALLDICRWILVQGNKIYLFIFPFMCISKSGLAANECYETSKLTRKLVDSSP